MDSEIHSRKAEALCLLDGADYDLAAGEMIAFLIKLIEAVVAVRNLVKIVMEDQLCDETFNEYKDFINRIYENLATGNIRAAQNKIPEARQIGNSLYAVVLYLPDSVNDRDSDSDSDSETDSDFDSGSEDEDAYPEMY